MNFSQLKVGMRLGISFGTVLFLLLCMVGMALFEFGAIHAEVGQIVEKDWVKAKLANQALDNARGSLARVFQLTAEEDKDRRREALDRLAANNQIFNEALDKLEQLVYLPEGKALVANSKALAAKYVEAYGKVVALAAEGRKEEAAQAAFGETYAALQAFAGELRKLNDLQQKIVDDRGEQADAVYLRARNVLLTLGALAVVLGAAAAVVVTRGLLAQLGGEPRDVIGIAGEIAGGNLAVAIDVKADDRRSLLFAIRTMRDSLANIVAEVRSGAESIGAASRQIASGNADLSGRTEEQAGSLEETASSMEELTGTVRQNADNARQANALAVSASGVALQGGTVVSQVVETMNSINESSQKIVDIIGVIDGIAFQTNILALNAAVEAARAGEQGRGFAVVAAEVRSLAQRSAQAAKEIKTLIAHSVETVDAGARLVDRAGATMREVVDSVKRVTDIMGEIASASQEQTAGIEQVNQAIAQMDQVTQQNAALVEESAAAAESMHEQANALTQAVGFFKLDSASARASHTPRFETQFTQPALKAVPKRKETARTGGLRHASSETPLALRQGTDDDWTEF